MFKARKQANIRKKVAFFFYTLAVISISLILFDIWQIDTTGASTASEIAAVKMSYYVFPIGFFVIGLFFSILSKIKATQAEAYDMRGSSWQM